MIFDTTWMPQVAVFLFVFAMMFGLLSYAKIAGFSNRVSAMLALVIAFFSVLYEPFVTGMQALLPFASILLVVVFFVIFMKKLLVGDEKSEKKDMIPFALAFGIAMLLVGLFWPNVAGYVPAGFDPNNILWIIGIVFVLVFFGAIYYHSKEEK
jgi:hypothetical protein